MSDRTNVTLIALLVGAFTLGPATVNAQKSSIENLRVQNDRAIKQLLTISADRLPQDSQKEIEVPPAAQAISQRIDPRVQLLIRAEMFNKKEAVWPGYSVFGQPILLYEAERCSYLLAHPLPPSDYHAVGSNLVTVFKKQGAIPDFHFTFRFHYPVNGVDSFAFRFEPGTDPKRDLITIVHERFHVHQDATFNMIPYDDQYPIAEAEDLALAALENHALRAAIEAEYDVTSRRYAKMFVGIRRLRYVSRGSAIRPVEDSQEQLEGLAEYVDLKLTGPPELGGRGKTFLVKLLAAPIGLENLGKWRSYRTGAAQGYLLDRAQFQDWKEAASKGTPLFDLIQRAYSVDLSEEIQLVQAAKGEFAYSALLAQARQDVLEFQQAKAEAIRAYESQAGLELLIPYPPVTLGTGFSNAGKIYILDDGSWLLTEMRVLESRGEGFSLYATQRPAILGNTGTIRFYIPRSATINGDGQALPISSGIYPFQILQILAPGVEFSAAIPGTIAVDSKHIRIEWDTIPKRHPEPIFTLHPQRNGFIRFMVQPN